MLIAINSNQEECDFYCGSATDPHPESPLKNPFEAIGEKAIEYYNRFLWAKIQSKDADVCESLYQILELHHAKIHPNLPWETEKNIPYKLGCGCGLPNCHVPGSIIPALQSPQVLTLLNDYFMPF